MSNAKTAIEIAKEEIEKVASKYKNILEVKYEEVKQPDEFLNGINMTELRKVYFPYVDIYSLVKQGRLLSTYISPSLKESMKATISAACAILGWQFEYAHNDDIITCYYPKIHGGTVDITEYDDINIEITQNKRVEAILEMIHVCDILKSKFDDAFAKLRDEKA
jgi:hypothetical protein